MVRLSIAPRTLFKAQLAIIAFLTVASLVGQVAKHRFGHPSVFGIVPLFDLDAEGNIPTYYSSLTLLLCSCLLFAIGHERKLEGAPYVRHWRFLGLAFLYISLDEFVQIHETVGTTVVSKLLGGRPQGIFHFAWVIPAVAGMMVFVAAYVPFLRHLPRRNAALFVLAGALYVGGALGMELLGGKWATTHGKTGMSYSLFTTVEEVLEMLGIAVFVNVLVRILDESPSHGLKLEVDFSKPATASR